MRPYWAVLRARFLMQLQYRAAALAGFGTQLFWGLMRAMIFTAFYAATTAPQPMSLDDAIQYVWLGQALLMLLPWTMDRDVEQMIRTGNVAYEMARPADLYWTWFCRNLALRLAPSLMRSVPMFIVAGLFLGLRPPVSWAAGAVFAASLVGALALSSALSTLMNISMFWTVSGEGISRLMPTAVFFLSGIIIPLPLFPDWMQPVLNWLPFRGIIDVPFRLYLGHLSSRQAPVLIGQQLLWVAAVIAIGRWLLRCGVRRLTVQGG